MKKNNGKNAAGALSAEKLLEFFDRQKRPMRLDMLLRTLPGAARAKKHIEKILFDLAREKALARLPGGLWARPDILRMVRGIFRASPEGGGLVETERGEIYVGARDTGGAWHQDLVSARMIPGGRGQIIEILERRRPDVAAIVKEWRGALLICRPADRRLDVEFEIFLAQKSPLAKKIVPGALLSVRPLEERAKGLWLAGIVNIFGSEDNIAAQEALVKCSRQVPGEFPALALEQAAALPDAPAKADFQGREDMRAIPFVTIDGADARDFDDAIHVERREGGWLLRVAIADVSHYVPPDAREGSLDSEALARGNSWYFPRSVEPMLPPALSNGLCSLRPGEDRLAMLAEIPFSRDGKPGSPRFAPIVMRSAGRLIYGDVEKFFSGRSMAGVPESVRPMLEHAFLLYRELAARRAERGSLDFDLPEPAYLFKEDGSLASVGVAARGDSNKLIEEFMIAANEAVARHLAAAKIPFLYRVHPNPEPEKLKTLFETLKATAPEILPPDIQKKGLPNPAALRQILARARGSDKEYVVNRLCLRSMQQARYQPENVGHFGLASDYYCHFTSPIRRYADLLTHRALKASLGLPAPKLPGAAALWETGEALNRLERRAVECERDMARRLGCLALKDRVGETFSGSVSGVTDFGLFVELNAMPVEGLIRIRSLGGEWLEFDEKRQRLIAPHSGKIWHLGQAVEARLEAVDLDKLEIRLIPAGAPRLSSLKRGKGGLPRKAGSGPKGRSAKKGAFPAGRWGKTGRRLAG